MNDQIKTRVLTLDICLNIKGMEVTNIFCDEFYEIPPGVYHAIVNRVEYMDDDLQLSQEEKQEEANQNWIGLNKVKMNKKQRRKL